MFEFYKGLGFPVTEECAPDNDWYGATFDIGGSTLWIWRDHDDVLGADKPPIQLVLKSSNMDGDYKALKAKGYDLTAPEMMFYGGREMNLTDLDGNQILFLD